MLVFSLSSDVESKSVAVAMPVITIPLGFACTLIFPPLSFKVVASIPVKLEPSPWNLVADTAPSVMEMAVPALIVVAVTTPVTSISPVLMVVRPTVTIPVTLAPLARI